MLAVDVKNIKKTFISKQDTVEAVKDVSFQVKKGEIFGYLVQMVRVNPQQF